MMREFDERVSSDRRPANPWIARIATVGAWLFVAVVLIGVGRTFGLY